MFRGTQTVCCTVYLTNANPYHTLSNFFIAY